MEGLLEPEKPPDPPGRDSFKDTGGLPKTPSLDEEVTAATAGVNIERDGSKRRRTEEAEELAEREGEASTEPEQAEGGAEKTLDRQTEGEGKKPAAENDDETFDPKLETIEGLCEKAANGELGDVWKMYYEWALRTMHKKNEYEDEEEDCCDKPGAKVLCAACPNVFCTACRPHQPSDGKQFCNTCLQQSVVEREDALRTFQRMICEKVMAHHVVPAVRLEDMKPQDKLFELLFMENQQGCMDLLKSKKGKSLVNKPLDKRVGLTPLLGAVDRCLPDVVKYLLADSRVDVRLTTMGKGIQKIGDLPCSLLLVAGLAYLNRRTTESQKIFGMVCRRPELDWEAVDWDGVSPLVNFQKAGAPLDFLNYVQRRGKNDDNTFMDVPAIPEPEGPGPNAKVVIISDKCYSIDRSSPPGTPLNPEHHLRTEFIVGKGGSLRSPSVAKIARYIDEVDPVELSELCKPGMHHPEYITYLKTLCANAPDPLDGCVGIDPGGDTFINNKTLLCGLKTAGAIERAVHEIKGGAMCAYVVCRRPGHHVGPTGAEISLEASFGFCIVNSVAYAALKAKELGYERVLIIDRDVHHGNGTSLMVRAMVEKNIFRPDEILLLDVCFHDNQSFYPYDPISKGSGTDFIKVVKVGPQRRKADRGPVYVNGLRTLIMSSGVPFKPTIVLVSNGMDGHDKDAGVHPAGVGGMTTKHMEEVVSTIKTELLERPNEQAVPSIWVMEGGYGANGGAAGPLARTHQDAVLELAK